MQSTNPSHAQARVNRAPAVAAVLSTLPQRITTPQSVSAPSKAASWIDEAFRRFLKGFAWRISEAGLRGRREEWLRAFAQDDIAPEVAELTVTMCVQRLQFVPSVKEFRDFLGSARREIENKYQRAKARNLPPNFIDVLMKKGAEICKILKKGSPDSNWFEVADMLTALKNSVRKTYPRASEIEVLELVLGQIK